MVEVIAYKSFNGRLFESEEKCLAYEKKWSQYPKVKEVVEVAKDFKGNDVAILKKTISRWNTPSSQRKDEVFYIVGGKYKVVGKYNLDCDLMTNAPNNHQQFNWGNFCTFIAERILSGFELTDESVECYLTIFNEIIKEDCVTFDVRILEKNKKWEFFNPKYLTGAIAPRIFTIEKIA